MPNQNNIESPFTLFSYGRSGTSVIHKCFEAHPDCDSVGETAELIFSTWHACELTKGIIRGDAPTHPGGARTHVQRWTEGTRAAFLAILPSEKRYWFQKPIGLPTCTAMVSQWGMDSERFCVWYWNVFTSLFPDAKAFTILRHPLDVVVSSQRYWGREPAEIMSGLMRVADLITHPDSRVGYAVNYDGLVCDPESELQKLCQYLEFPYSPLMLTATQALHVPRVGVQTGDPEHLRDKREQTFSRKEQWGDIDAALMPREFWPKINALWERFGREPLAADGG